MSTPPPSTKARFPLLRWLRRGRVSVILGVTLVIFLIVQSDAFRGMETVQRWEGQAHDIRFRLRGPLPLNPDVLIVGVSTSSFDQKGIEAYAQKSEPLRLMVENPGWPWPRTIHAHVIERLLAAGARVVAVDIVFAANKAEDAALAEVLAKYPGRIVLAATTQMQSADPLSDKISRTQFIAQQPNSKLLAAAGAESMGFVTFASDVDDVRRHFDYRTSDVRENPTLAGVVDDTRDLWKFAPLAVAKFTGKPLPSEYDQPLNFTGPARSYQARPVEELFIDSVWRSETGGRGGAAFRDKLVFYGPIAEVLHDTLNTPYGEMPGVEIHAQLAASLLEGRTLRDASPLLTRTLALLGTLAAALAVLFIPNAIAQVAAVLALGALLAFGTQLAFTHGGVLVPVVPTIFGLALTGALGVVYQFLLEQWEKAHTRKVLNRFVSKRIAAVVLRNAEEFENARRGEKRPVAILFSDIRSFTSWSEKAEPEHLVGQLNEYFERMVNHIEAQDGNVQKFIGDAILAAWGDTHTNGPADDAARAVRTALAMRKSLGELNSAWAERPERIVITIGIGINHGDVVVGEVGHPERREYTVLGDGVNFAARMESATKQFHTDCLVGESVEALTRARFIYRHVDYVRVKGKTRPVNIYIPLSDHLTPPPEWLADYHRARALYIARDFPAAAALFREVKERIGEDFLCQQYADRCTHYTTEPPPPDWDGSYTLTEK